MHVATSLLAAFLLLQNAATESKCWMTGPRPRGFGLHGGVQGRFPPMAGGLSLAQVPQMPLQLVSRSLGPNVAGAPPGLGMLPCGGAPPLLEEVPTMVCGAQIPVSWYVEEPAPAQCAVALICTHHNIERRLWSGPCGEHACHGSAEVSLPNDVYGTSPGDCFVQWKMDTREGHTYVGCSDVVIAPPKHETESLTCTERPSIVTSVDFQEVTSTIPPETFCSSTELTLSTCVPKTDDCTLHSMTSQSMTVPTITEPADVLCTTCIPIPTSVPTTPEAAISSEPSIHAKSTCATLILTATVSVPTTEHLTFLTTKTLVESHLSTLTTTQIEMVAPLPPITSIERITETNVTTVTAEAPSLPPLTVTQETTMIETAVAEILPPITVTQSLVVTETAPAAEVPSVTVTEATTVTLDGTTDMATMTETTTVQEFDTQTITEPMETTVTATLEIGSVLTTATTEFATITASMPMPIGLPAEMTTTVTEVSISTAFPSETAATVTIPNETQTLTYIETVTETQLSTTTAIPEDAGLVASPEATTVTLSEEITTTTTETSVRTITGVETAPGTTILPSTITDTLTVTQSEVYLTTLLGTVTVTVPTKGPQYTHTIPESFASVPLAYSSGPAENVTQTTTLEWTIIETATTTISGPTSVVNMPGTTIVQPGVTVTVVDTPAPVILPSPTFTEMPLIPITNAPIASKIQSIYTSATPTTETLMATGPAVIPSLESATTPITAPTLPAIPPAPETTPDVPKVTPPTLPNDENIPTMDNAPGIHVELPPQIAAKDQPVILSEQTKAISPITKSLPTILGNSTSAPVVPNAQQAPPPPIGPATLPCTIIASSTIPSIVPAPQISTCSVPCAASQCTLPVLPVSACCTSTCVCPTKVACLPPRAVCSCVAMESTDCTCDQKCTCKQTHACETQCECGCQCSQCANGSCSCNVMESSVSENDADVTGTKEVPDTNSRLPLAQSAQSKKIQPFHAADIQIEAQGYRMQTAYA